MNFLLALGTVLLVFIYAGEAASLPRRHLSGAAPEAAPGPTAKVALPLKPTSFDALLTITNPPGSGAVALPIAAGSTVRASTTQFIVVSPLGAVQAAVAIVPGKGRVDVQPSAKAHGAITFIDTAGNSFQVSLERPAAPAPGLPSDLTGSLSAQPRYDVSTGFSYSGPSSYGFGYSFSGSNSGVSYSEKIAVPYYTGSESIGVSYSG